MNIQVVGPTTLRCGVAEYGRLLAHHLGRRGHQIVGISDLPSPIGYSGTDVLLLNWHGGLHGHLREEHLPPDIPVVLYVHESFPCDNRRNTPIWDFVDLVVAPEKVEPEGHDRTEVVPMACPEIDPHTEPPTVGPLRVGATGLRQEGSEPVKRLCEAHGWEFHTAGGSYEGKWESNNTVVNQLAQNHVNVFHYGNAYGGQSMAVMYAVAARRPILLSNCRQFASLRPYDGKGIRFYSTEAELEDILRVRSHTLHAQHLWRKPKQCYEERNWGTAAWKWEKVLESVL